MNAVVEHVHSPDVTQGSPVPPGLPEMLASAAKALQQPRTVDGVVTAIARTACSTIPGVDHAGVCHVGRDGTAETHGATHDVMRVLEEIQGAVGEGPGVESLDCETVLAVPTIAHEQRWPRYIPLAVETGVRSQLAVRLQASGRSSWRLDLCSTTSDSIHPDAVRATGLFAVHAGGALAAARREAQLREALETRTAIGTAIGLVMERYQLDEDRAFKFLLRRSQDDNVKLRLVAEEIVLEADARAA